jgi:hypothetical protein
MHDARQKRRSAPKYDDKSPEHHPMIDKNDANCDGLLHFTWIPK